MLAPRSAVLASRKDHTTEKELVETGGTVRASGVAHRFAFALPSERLLVEHVEINLAYDDLVATPPTS
jgi:hypothetical protein